jgi:hypothetical protein
MKPLRGTTARRTVVRKLIRWLAAIPFVGMLSGPVVHNQVHPLILGMPFPLGWVAVWVVLTSVIMAIVYTIDPANHADDGQ